LPSISKHICGKLEALIVSLLLFGACVPKAKVPSSQSSETEKQAGAFNADDVIFGPELEFTDPVTAKVKWGYAVDTEYLRVVEILCKNDPTVECAIELKSVEVKSKTSSARVKTFPYYDNGVLELPLDPMTIAQAQESKSLIQKFTFDAAKEMGLTPGTKEYNRWCAHLNFSWPGLRTGEQGDLFLRYFVDFNSRPELGMGAFGGDIRNAPMLAMESENVQAHLVKVVNDFNEGGAKASAFDVASRLREVYAKGKGYMFKDDPSHRYNALNVAHVSKDARAARDYNIDSRVRIEQRASYMPLSADHLISNYKVIAGRLGYLSKQTRPIVFTPIHIAMSAERNFNTVGVQEGFDAEQVARTYVRYLEEADLDKEYHISYMMNPIVQTEAAKIAKMNPEKIAELQRKAATLLKVTVDEYRAKTPTIAK
jgi:hypothetical protein